MLYLVSLRQHGPGRLTTASSVEDAISKQHYWVKDEADVWVYPMEDDNWVQVKLKGNYILEVQ